MLINTNRIPDSLWRRLPAASGAQTQILRLPRMLVKVYRDLLTDLDLIEEAKNQSPNDEGPQGGLTEEATLEHFSRNFSGSCARIELVMLDPKEIFETTRDVFVKLFSGGRLHLLDIPCGAGAASATLLCLAAELRQQGVLPRQPLYVTVVGGDKSKPARLLKRKLYRKLAPRLLEFGIRVSATVRDWDIEDEDQTSELVVRWVQTRPNRSAAAVFALNFSGFLSNKVKDCKAQLKEILRYARIQGAPVVWVEPRTNSALEHLYPALIRHVLSGVPKLESKWGADPRRSECVVVHPVQDDGQFTVRSAAMHLEPVRENS